MEGEWRAEDFSSSFQTNPWPENDTVPLLYPHAALSNREHRQPQRATAIGRVLGGGVWCRRSQRGRIAYVL